MTCAVAVKGQDTAAYLFEQGYAHQVGDGIDRDTKRALAYYTEAIRLDPTFYAPLYNTALIYYEQGNYIHAQNYFVNIDFHLKCPQTLAWYLLNLHKLQKRDRMYV